MITSDGENPRLPPYKYHPDAIGLNNTSNYSTMDILLSLLVLLRHDCSNLK